MTALRIPKRRYTRETLAALLGISEADVDILTARHDATNTPARLNEVRA